ncbi:hypothetical protein K503DRAFT_718150 [Rhizopogon vinicolor AM-OR11-026]|uniref:RING-type domain-containing protein n=1 Tax=Rhizopogon vinicolor AM-OR11-026 TaxID=1314800 RepID=A0A1B7N0T4_9AGAM|nr:hypothetical protein K503DRAFT_718150 [Rhizopogon vinicolor AM-OR11-026]
MTLCPLCPAPATQANFNTPTELELHIKKMHATGLRLRCELCQQSFKKNAALVQHLATKYHHKCKVAKCSQKFMTPTELSTHAQHHNVPIPAKFPCASCDTEFGALDALQHHMSVAHLPKYPCTSCHQIFSSSNAFDEHQSISHPAFTCPYCNQRFSILEALLAHGRQEHPGSSSNTCSETATSHASSSPSHAVLKAQSCSMCKQSFSTVDELSYHTRTVHPLKTAGIICGLCQQSFTTNSALISHLGSKKHHKCRSCSQKFTTTAKLSAHMSTTHPKLPHYPCLSCLQVFSSSSALDEHRSITHPPPAAKKIYPCGSCDRTFSKESEFTAHGVTAHPVGPVCVICRLTCPSKQVLNDHVAAVHPTCVECDIWFDDHAGYATHRRTSHPEPTPVTSPPASHSCPFCELSFQFTQALDDHMAAIHPFTCGMCEFACPKEELLQEHITSAHSCPVCHEGVFANPDLLNEHLVDHATPYRCELCETRYAQEEDLHLHYRDSPDDIHPSCTRCDLSFQDAFDYYNHTETVHPQVSCQLCDGALFDPGELPMHYLTSRNHPVCDICQIGFSDQADFAIHGAMEHPEAYCHLCQWQFESSEALQNHIRHFVAHPKCMDCELRFADGDAYQHHLFVVHRPHCSSAATHDPDLNFMDNSEGEGDVHSEKRMSNPLASDPVDPTWGFSGNPDFIYAQFIPLPPSSSGYSSPLSQRVPTRSSIGSRSSSRTLSPPPIAPTKDAYLGTSYPVDNPGSPYFEQSPFSNIPAVGTPLVSSTDLRSPFSPRPETPALFSPSQQVNDASHSDQESIATAKSPETNSPVIKLPEYDASSMSSSGWSTLSAEAELKISPKSETSLNEPPTDLVVPVLRLQVPPTNGTSQTVSVSASPSSISPESAGIDISANVTPDYLREARAYLAVTHPTQASSNADHAHSPALASPSLSSIGLTVSSRERRREVRFEDSIMSEPMWDNQSTESSDSSFDPPVMQNRRKYGMPKRLGTSKLPRFAPLRPGRGTGRLNSSIHSSSTNGTTCSLSPYHCRICRRDTCEDLTTTTCGHLFCNACITDAVIRDSRCPVCMNAVLLYCLFRIDTTCDA